MQRCAGGRAATRHAAAVGASRRERCGGCCPVGSGRWCAAVLRQAGRARIGGTVDGHGLARARSTNVLASCSRAATMIHSQNCWFVRVHVYRMGLRRTTGPAPVISATVTSARAFAVRVRYAGRDARTCAAKGMGPGGRLRARALLAGRVPYAVPKGQSHALWRTSPHDAHCRWLDAACRTTAQTSWCSFVAPMPSGVHNTVTFLGHAGRHRWTEHEDVALLPDEDESPDQIE